MEEAAERERERKSEEKKNEAAEAALVIYTRPGWVLS
jgi:hypothetical protein